MKTARIFFALLVVLIFVFLSLPSCIDPGGDQPAAEQTAISATATWVADQFFEQLTAIANPPDGDGGAQ